MALLIALVNIIGWGLIPLTVKDSPQSQMQEWVLVLQLLLLLFICSLDQHLMLQLGQLPL